MASDGFSEFKGIAPGSANYNFGIEGSNSQVCTVNVPPGERLLSEPGCMFFMSNGIEAGAECAPGWFQRCCCMAENCFQVAFKNAAQEAQYVGITPNFPGKVIGINLKDQGPGMIVKSGGYMAGIGNVELDLSTDCCSKTCCCGLGPCRQHIHGDGVAFLAAGGTIMEKQLAANETLKIDITSLVGFQSDMEYKISVNGCCPCCCGGEACYNVLTGPGTVYLQSMNYQKYRAALVPPEDQNGRDGSGTAGA